MLPINGGIGVAGDSFGFMDPGASLNGFSNDGCATLGSGSVLTMGCGAFLKAGSFGLGFGAEKKDESDLTSFTSFPTDLPSFFTTVLEDDAAETASFFVGGIVFETGASALCFLTMGSMGSFEYWDGEWRGTTHPLSLLLGEVYWQRRSAVFFV